MDEMKNFNDNIKIRISDKNIGYLDALKFMQKHVDKILYHNGDELIWFLNHDHIYTFGTSAKKSEIINITNTPIVQTNRGGKTTYHGPGQRIVYLMINLSKKKRDIRKFVNIIENSIIFSLKSFGIHSYSDRKNIGIWTKLNNEDKKVAAIGIKVKRWVAYHGFSINIDNDVSNYRKIIPCGIRDKDVTTLKKINNQNYSKLSEEIIKNLITNLKI